MSSCPLGRNSMNCSSRTAADEDCLHWGIALVAGLYSSPILPRRFLKSAVLDVVTSSFLLDLGDQGVFCSGLLGHHALSSASLRRLLQQRSGRMPCMWLVRPRGALKIQGGGFTSAGYPSPCLPHGWLSAESRGKEGQRPALLLDGCPPSRGVCRCR